MYVKNNCNRIMFSRMKARKTTLFNSFMIFEEVNEKQTFRRFLLIKTIRKQQNIVYYLTVTARYHSTTCVHGIFSSFWIFAFIDHRTGALYSFGTCSISVYSRRRVFFQTAFQSSQVRSSTFNFFIILLINIMHFSSSFSAIILRFACVFFVRIKALIVVQMSDSVPINSSICSSVISCHFSSSSRSSSYEFRSCHALFISSAGVVMVCNRWKINISMFDSVHL